MLSARMGRSIIGHRTGAVITTGSVFVLFALTAGCENDWIPDAISSDCKSEKSTSVTSTSRYRDIEAIDLSGLYCVSFSAGEGEKLQIELVNYYGNCLGPYGAKVDIVDTGVLEIDTKRLSDCNMVATCMCDYDLSLSIASIDRKTDLNLVVEHRECEGGKGECRDVATLPVATRNSGFACRHGYRGRKEGELNHRCNNIPDEPECSSGLVCRNDRCLASCDTDADCPSSEVYTCSTGVCIPALPLELVCD